MPIAIDKEVTRTGEAPYQRGAYPCAAVILDHQLLPTTVCHVDLSKYCQYLQTAFPPLGLTCRLTLSAGSSSRHRRRGGPCLCNFWQCPEALPRAYIGERWYSEGGR